MRSVADSKTIRRDGMQLEKGWRIVTRIVVSGAVQLRRSIALLTYCDGSVRGLTPFLREHFVLTLGQAMPPVRI